MALEILKLYKEKFYLKKGCDFSKSLEPNTVIIYKMLLRFKNIYKYLN